VCVRHSSSDNEQPEQNTVKKKNGECVVRCVLVCVVCVCACVVCKYLNVGCPLFRSLTTCSKWSPFFITHSIKCSMAFLVAGLDGTAY